MKIQTGTHQFDFIAQHKGMFSVIGANADQVTRLREQFGVYLVDGGRINLAGLKESDVPFLAESLSAVMA
jgi:aspartate aminotransferase